MLSYTIQDTTQDTIMQQFMRKIDEQLMDALLSDHRKRITALRATRPVPGCVRSFGTKHGLVTAVTDDAVWMMGAHGQLRIS